MAVSALSQAIGQGNRQRLEPIGLQLGGSIANRLRHFRQFALVMLEAELPRLAALTRTDFDDNTTEALDQLIGTPVSKTGFF